jgi:hypothetical protein
MLIIRLLLPPNKPISLKSLIVEILSNSQYNGKVYVTMMKRAVEEGINKSDQKVPFLDPS